MLWEWQTGAGADAPAMTYMIDGVQYVSIAAGGVTANGVGSQRGDMLWTFALNAPSKLQPMPNPTQLPIIVTGFTGAIVPGATLTPPNKVTIADFGYTPNRIQVKAGDTINFVNNGPTGHTATATDGTGWDTGLLETGGAASFTFDTAGHVLLHVHAAPVHGRPDSGRGRRRQSAERDARERPGPAASVAWFRGLQSEVERLSRRLWTVDFRHSDRAP